jgi:hypothetical protein
VPEEGIVVSVIVETDVELPPISDNERASLLALLDQFLAGTTRNLIPVAEVQDLALDMRNVLCQPVVHGTSDEVK